MTKQLAISVGLLAVFAVSLAVLQPHILQSDAAAQQANLQRGQQSTKFEYGRLVFDGENYNWIAGDRQILQSASARNLINRLNGRANRANFATLLDTLGSAGWELVFETEDPEGYGQVLIFKRQVK